MTKRQYANMFRKAARLIEGGWGQMNWVSSEDCYCIGGALNKATLDVACLPNNVSRAMYSMLEELLGMPPTGQWLQLSRWNDQPERTKPHVVSLLRLAAKKLDHGWSPIYWDYNKLIKASGAAAQT